MQPLLLVDGDNILVRAAEATRSRNLADQDGVPTAALVGFAMALGRHIRDLQPYRVAVCWDAGHTQRSALYPAYKANRNGSDAYRTAARLLAVELLKLTRVHQVRAPGEEADDLIAAHWATATEPVVVLSADKDLLQLTGTTPAGLPCTQLRPATDGTQLWDADRVQAEYGCTPEQLPSLMALVGDRADNIPGVPRFGAKTAAKHLQAAGWDLDAVDHPNAVAHRAQTLINLALIDLRAPRALSLAPVPAFWPLAPNEGPWTQLAQWLTRHQLTELTHRLALGRLW